MKWFTIFSMLSSFTVYGACTLDPAFTKYNVKDFQGEPVLEKSPGAGIVFLTPEEVNTLSKDVNVVLIDTRPKMLFDQCHIKGSQNIPFGAKEMSADNILTKDIVEKYIKDGKTIVFYCNALQCYRGLNATLQSICEWNQPAEKIKWYPKGVPGFAKQFKRAVDGTNCQQFF